MKVKAYIEWYITFIFSVIALNQYKSPSCSSSRSIDAHVLAITFFKNNTVFSIYSLEF